MNDRTLLEHWFILYNRKWLIFAVTIAAMVSAFVASKSLDPVYEAKAVFFVPAKTDIMKFFSPEGSGPRVTLAPMPDEDSHAPYLGILKSKTIAEMVQKEFPHKSLLALMIRDIDFTLTNEYMIEVHARDNDPAIAAGISNAYVKYFNQLMSGYSQPSGSRIEADMENEISVIEEKTTRAILTLKEFQEKNSTANLDVEVNQLVGQRAAFQTRLEGLEVDYEGTSAKLAVTENELKKEQAIFKSDEPVFDSPLLSQLNEKLADLDVKLSMMKVEFQDSHPDVVALNKSIETVQDNINKEVERISKSKIKASDTFGEELRRQLINLTIDKERISANIKATRKVLRDIEIRIKKIPLLQSELEILNNEVDRYKKLMDNLKLNLAETRAQKERTLQVAVPVEVATPPGSPSFPVLWLNLLVASMSGFLVGVSYCFFIDYLESTRDKRILRLLRAIKASEE